MVSSQSSIQTSCQPTVVPEPTMTTTQLGAQTSQESFSQEPCIPSTWVLSIPYTTDEAQNIVVPSNVTSMSDSIYKPKKLCHSDKNKKYPKPTYSYSCLIALALKNSASGRLKVTQIYCFITDYFPYFRTASKYWKNAVRHCLSLNKCFQKIELSHVAKNRKSCLWTLNQERADKMDEALKKWYSKDPEGITNAMEYPEFLSILQEGSVKLDYSNTEYIDIDSNSEDEDDGEIISTTANFLPDRRLTTDKAINPIHISTVGINQNVTVSTTNFFPDYRLGIDKVLSPDHTTVEPNQNVIHVPQNQTVFSPIGATPSLKSNEITILDDPEIICVD